MRRFSTGSQAYILPEKCGEGLHFRLVLEKRCQGGQVPPRGRLAEERLTDIDQLSTQNRKRTGSIEKDHSDISQTPVLQESGPLGPQVSIRLHHSSIAQENQSSVLWYGRIVTPGRVSGQAGMRGCFGKKTTRNNLRAVDIGWWTVVNPQLSVVSGQPPSMN